MGLGLAMARPEAKIAVLTGDGEQLMGLGALATIGVAKPKNLAIIVLDNGHFGETGMQRSHTSEGVDLSGVAASCGFREHKSAPRSLPILDGTELKNRFRRTLNLNPL